MVLLAFGQLFHFLQQRFFDVAVGQAAGLIHLFQQGRQALDDRLLAGGGGGELDSFERCDRPGSISSLTWAALRMRRPSAAARAFRAAPGADGTDQVVELAGQAPLRSRSS